MNKLKYSKYDYIDFLTATTRVFPIQNRNFIVEILSMISDYGIQA